MPGTISGPQGADVWLDNCGNLGGALLKFPSSSRTCCKNLPLESMRRFMPRPQSSPGCFQQRQSMGREVGWVVE